MKDIMFDSCVEYDNKLWFVPYGDTLMYMDLDTYKYHYVFPEPFVAETENASGNMLAKDGIIYWTKLSGTTLAEYDINKNDLNFFELPALTFENWSCILCRFFVGEDVILVPKYDNFLVKFNSTTKDIKKIQFPDTADDLTKKGIDRAICLGELLFCFFNESRKMWIYNPSTDESSYEDYPDKIDSIISACTCDDGLILIDNTKGVFFKTTNSEVKNFEISLPTERGLLIPVSGSFYFFSNSDDNLYYLESVDNSWQVFSEYPRDFKLNEMKWPKYLLFNEGTQKIWVNSRSSNYNIAIDKQSKKLIFISPQLYNKTDTIKRRLLTAGNTPIMEENTDDLEGFIEYINQL